MPGFARGRKLGKIGLYDTAELFFDDVRVGGQLARPGGRRLRALHGTAAAGAAVDRDDGAGVGPRRAGLNRRLRHPADRVRAPRAAFQNTQFELAASVTEVDVLEAYLDKSGPGAERGTLTAVNAAKARLWATEVSTASWTGARSCSAVTTT
jgi:acyl-CoA dehydrogenase